jgi:signal transduction histidine kinase
MRSNALTGTARRALHHPVLRAPGRMLAGPLRDVRSTSLRVAFVATVVVFVAYVVIASAVVVIVNRNLTAAVDDRLHSYINQLFNRPAMGSTDFPQGGSRLQEPLLTWVVLPSGWIGEITSAGELVAVQGTSNAENLPDRARAVSTPTTVTLSDGNDVRLDGATVNLRINPVLVVPNTRVIVGQSLDNVATTQHNVITAELIVGPILLLAVFLGAYTIGRRVGSPIERARQRQIELTADASHELRTPLSVIEAQTALALARDRDPEWYRNAFQAVGVESKRMRRLVDDLLWLARFDSTGQAPSSEPTDLGVLATQAAGRFDAVAQSRGLTLQVNVDPVSTTISAPPEWLDRLLGVLLDNACRYTPEGGSVEVQVGRRDGRVRVAVDDSGPGIPAEERSHIFDRFRRASDTPGGSGLGLAIAAAVVGASGGRWDVGQSAAGGASMAVSWSPLVRGVPEPQETAEASGPAPTAPPSPPPPRPA